MKAQSKRSIERRNERINGRRNAESLDFMTYVKHAPTEELVHQRHYAMDWQRHRSRTRTQRRDEQGRTNHMKSATAIGAYLVGLSAKTIAITSTALPTSDFRIDLSHVPCDRGRLPNGWENWQRETRTRVRSSLTSLGIDTGFAISFDHFLAFGPHIDVAILAACLGAIGKLPSHMFASSNPDGCKIFLGELGLQGQIRPTRGILAFLVDYVKTRTEDDERPFVVPYDCAIEASHINTGTNVCAIGHVSELFDLHEHTVARSEYRAPKPVDHIGSELHKLSDRVVRTVERAVIDGKPIHLVGANADRCVRLLRSILPPMTRDEAIESARLLSVAGLMQPAAIGQIPYRAPHHTVDERGLVGGGFPPCAGEASLAHHGLLCLFDLPQFKRTAIEVLAPVLREGRSSLWRRSIRAEFPARARLVTTAMRCPCVGERRNGEHSEYCGERADRKTGHPFREETYLGWKTRFTKELGIETIVDVDFAEGDGLCTDKLESIRKRVFEGTTR